MTQVNILQKWYNFLKNKEFIRYKAQKTIAEKISMITMGYNFNLSQGDTPF